MNQRQGILLLSTILIIPLIITFQNFYPAPVNLPTGYSCFSSSTSLGSNSQIYKCLNRSYIGSGGFSYNWDLYLPKNFAANSTNKYPVVVLIHGGAWGGDRYPQTDFAERLAGYGYVVANIEYFSATNKHNEIDTARRWTENVNAPKDIGLFMDNVIFSSQVSRELRLDLNKVNLAGFSAGAHLALLEATRGNQKYYGAFVGSAPTRIDRMGDPKDPNWRYALSNVFENQNMRASMSPFNKISSLKLKYLFMEGAVNDTLAPFDDQFGFFMNIPENILPMSRRVANVMTSYDYVCRLVSDNSKVDCPSPAPSIYNLDPKYYYELNHNVSGVSKLEENLVKIYNEEFKAEYERTRIKLAKSNSEVWPVSATIDGNPYTQFTTAGATRYNTQGFNLEGQMMNPSPTSINGLVLSARMAGNTPLGFPKSYNVFLTNSSNTAWVLVGNFNDQPNSVNKGLVEIKFSQVYQTYGVLIVPTEMGTDNYGNYYLQMADFDLTYRSDY